MDKNIKQGKGTQRSVNIATTHKAIPAVSSRVAPNVLPHTSQSAPELSSSGMHTVVRRLTPILLRKNHGATMAETMAFLQRIERASLLSLENSRKLNPPPTMEQRRQTAQSAKTFARAAAYSRKGGKVYDLLLKEKNAREKKWTTVRFDPPPKKSKSKTVSIANKIELIPTRRLRTFKRPKQWKFRCLDCSFSECNRCIQNPFLCCYGEACRRREFLLLFGAFKFLIHLSLYIWILEEFVDYLTRSRSLDFFLYDRSNEGHYYADFFWFLSLYGFLVARFYCDGFWFVANLLIYEKYYLKWLTMSCYVSLGTIPFGIFALAYFWPIYSGVSIYMITICLSTLYDIWLYKFHWQEIVDNDMTYEGKPVFNPATDIPQYAISAEVIANRKFTNRTRKEEDRDAPIDEPRVVIPYIGWVDNSYVAAEEYIRAHSNFTNYQRLQHYSLNDLLRRSTKPGIYRN